MALPSGTSQQLLLLLLMLLASIPLGSSAGEVVELDEANWEKMLDGGQWYVQFHAPWCSSCQRLAPAWRDLATRAPKTLKVAQVDVTSNEALSGMFLVSSLPSVFLVQGDRFWLYSGERSAPALLQFAASPAEGRRHRLGWHRAPSGWHMRCLGRLIKAAVSVKRLHAHLVEARGLSSPAAYAALVALTLATGLVVGLLLVCLCDCICARRRKPPAEGDRAEEKLTEEEEEEDEAEEMEEEPPADSEVRRRAAASKEA